MSCEKLPAEAESSPESGSPDDAYLEAAIAEAERTGEPIPDTVVRMIASQHHSGQASALYSLASCGAIDMLRLRGEYIVIYADPNTPEADKQKLDHLGEYLLEHGDRGPVPNWHELWGSHE